MALYRFNGAIVTDGISRRDGEIVSDEYIQAGTLHSLIRLGRVVEVQRQTPVESTTGDIPRVVADKKPVGRRNKRGLTNG